MEFILDMVHHNPGEPPFESAFLNPAHLAEYGYNGQVFKHINCVATFDKLGLDIFPANSPERSWLEQFTPPIELEIAKAKAQGLQVFYHLDLFVLPKKLVEIYQDEICGEDGRISLDKPKTLELHKVLFDELFERFPQLDGFIIRVGETYLFDTPFHIGNSPIPRVGNSWTPTYFYDETLHQKESEPTWANAQVSTYIKLINFLREEICVKHDKVLMFRTWDIFPDKLHAVPEHFLQVTNQIAPHDKLIFSIKHTALDFWRRVKVNECLGLGKHSQIIEVQCQREYEGKGAYPNYVMDGVINGFEENAVKIGLANLLQNPLIRGVYSWSRGGGWYGPYIKSEFWADLNAYVLANFAKDSSVSEAEIFAKYCREKMFLDEKSSAKFRQICFLSARAILKGRHCETFDKSLNESVLPTACWMRDDRLGGREQLAEVLEYLYANQLFTEALNEKNETVKIWDEIKKLGDEIDWKDENQREIITTSIEYGRLLFNIVGQGWRVMCLGFEGEKTGEFEREKIVEAVEKYDSFWLEYKKLADLPFCASLYQGIYFNLPDTPEVKGLDETIEFYKKLV
jgi:hypothetical protein